MPTSSNLSSNNLHGFGDIKALSSIKTTCFIFVKNYKTEQKNQLVEFSELFTLLSIFEKFL